MKIFLMVLLYILIGLIAFSGLYFGADFLLSRISANTESTSGLPKDIQIYVLSNDVHTDLVFPIRNEKMDWSTVFALDNTLSKDTSQQWVSIGWGDKGFYLNTPEWKDLKASTALVAALGIGETALHVTYYRTLQEDKLCFKVMIDANQYQILTEYVLSSLDRDTSNKAILIQTTAHYGGDDAFYEAKGAYNLFFSCNTWTNKGLKEANLPSGIWTVFDKGILRHYGL